MTTVLVLVVASALLRRVTLFLNRRAFSVVPPFKKSFGQKAGIPLLVLAWGTALLSVLGALFLPYPGLWGPAVLVFSVVWTMNRKSLVLYLPWYAPVEIALEQGDRVVLLGGAAGTLIAYVAALPA